MKSFFICFFLFSFPFILSSESEKITIDNLTIFKNPTELPRNFLSSFIPDHSQILFNSDFKKFGYESIETSVIFETKLTTDELNQYYELLLKTLDWKILQFEKKEGKSIFLAEKRLREVVSIIFIQKEKFSLVKIFIKKQSNY